MYKDKSDREAVYKAVIDDFNEAAALFWVLSDTYSEQTRSHDRRAAATAFCARTMLYHAYDDKGVANKTEMAEILAKLNTITASCSLATDVLDTTSLLRLSPLLF